MRFSYAFMVGLGLLGGTAASAAAQQLNNDGFHRRNGQMYVLRNGQLRPMVRDARLPTGAVVTKDGFVVSREGRRAELREGQGCDLKGNMVAVMPAAGGLALGNPGRGRRAAGDPDVEQVREVLEGLLGGGRRYDDDDRDDDKYDEKMRERLKKEAEWRREAAKKQEEYERERGKKWKEKWKKHKGWDD